MFSVRVTGRGRGLRWPRVVADVQRAGSHAPITTIRCHDALWYEGLDYGAKILHPAGNTPDRRRHSTTLLHAPRRLGRCQSAAPMPPNLEVWHLQRPLTRLALGTERAVRLMKDHFIDGLTLAAKFDNEALQFDNAKPSAVLRGKAIGGLVVGL